MSKDFWNQDNIVMLIQLYESNKLLWDISDKEYKNKFKRKDAYAAIATELGVNAEEVKKKIDSILAQYRREKKTNILKSGMGTSEKKKPWWGFPYLQFLSGNNSTPQETFSNLTEPNNPAVDMDSSDIDDNDIDNVCRETASSISSSSAEMKELEEMQKENEVTAYTTQERPAPSHPPEHGSTDVSLLVGTSLLDLPDNFSHL
ncbi:hypothetical protein J6590_086404 [Homalodisca vitripennis]|nr:hypothetical protein J6590_086404 [Homalodisca vitripennis]